MTALRIDIVVDPAKALGGAELAKKAVKAIAQEAVLVEHALTDMQDAFAAMSLSGKKSIGELGRSFGGLADQLGREAKLLESIKGPMRDLEQRHQALDALLRRGSITAEEYAKALAKVRTEAGVVTDAPKAAGTATKAVPTALDKGPFQYLPSFLKLGGQAQETAAQLSAGAGLAAQKFGLMDGAAGKVVGAMQSFALGGPVGIAVFALGELSTAIGGVSSKLAEAGKAVGENTLGNIALRFSGVDYDGLSGAVKKYADEVKKATEIAGGFKEAATRDLVTMNAYAGALEGMKGALEGRNGIGAGSIEALQAQGRTVLELRDKYRELATEIGEKRPTEEQQAAMTKLEATIKAAEGATKDWSNATVLGTALATASLNAHKDGLLKIEALGKELEILNNRRASGEGAAIEIVIAKQKELGDLQRAQLVGGSRVLADAKESIRASKELRQSLAEAIVLAKANGDTDEFKKLTKDLKDADAAAKGALGGSGGLSAYGQYIANLNAPLKDLISNEKSLARAMREGAISFDVATAETKRLADEREKLLGFSGTRREDSAPVASRQFADMGSPIDQVDPRGEMAKAFNDQIATRKQLLDSIKTPLDDYYEQLAAINSVQDSMTASQYDELIKRAGDALAEATPKAETFTSALKDAVTDLQPAFEDLFKGMAEGLLDSSKGWDGLGDSVADFAAKALSSLAQLLAQKALTAIFGDGNSTGGSGGSGGGGGSIGGVDVSHGAGWGAASVGIAAAGHVFGFASGGSFTVGGGGGTDTTPVAFMATAGERVIVQTPDQQRAHATTTAPPAQIINQYDPRAMTDVVGTGRGRRAQVNNLRADHRTIKRLLRV